jgi:hypothetical protein
VKVKDATGKIAQKVVSRDKISKHGKKAKEQYSINIRENRKFHHVEEQDESGNWTVVHHEDEPLKGKKKKP